MKMTAACWVITVVAATMPAGCGDDVSPGPDGGVSSDTGSSADAGASDGSASCGTTCEECFACPATVAACASAQDACDAEPDCAAFRSCAGETDDPTAVAACRADHPAGAAAFCAYWGCLSYDRCDAVCEDAVICPRS